ncbi:SA1362 family protein [Staphylococcus aureus]|uniref:SA1362 family protein n=2 Tax=Staphylococcus aureus TaxID=1280 RepID=UPI0009915AF6|nr:SA1362 family protein [Staphylococcus aureus]
MRNIIFYLVLIIAAIGLVMNLDAFIFSIVRMLVSFAVIAGIIYLIYYFFILTEDQRKYRVNSGLKMLFYGGLKMSFFSGLRLSYI